MRGRVARRIRRRIYGDRYATRFRQYTLRVHSHRPSAQPTVYADERRRLYRDAKRAHTERHGD